MKPRIGDDADELRGDDDSSNWSDDGTAVHLAFGEDGRDAAGTY